MRPAPGWCIVRPVETDEQYAGSKLFIPDWVRDRVARYQAEVVQIGEGGFCEDLDCPRSHTEEEGHRQHRVPDSVEPGAWVLLTPRGLASIPGETQQFLVSQDEIRAVFVD